MTIKEFLKLIVPHFKKSLLLSLAFSLAVFLGSFALPISYKAVATFYVKRGVDRINSNYFTYEGYYSSQTAERYTDTVIGFLRSPDIRKEALERLNMDANSKTLGVLEDNIVVKKAGPQLISMTIEGKNRNEVFDMWESLASLTIAKSTSLNSNADSLLLVSVIGDQPLVLESTPSPYILGLISFPLFLGLFLLVFAFKRYLKS